MATLRLTTRHELTETWLRRRAARGIAARVSNGRVNVLLGGRRTARLAPEAALQTDAGGTPISVIEPETTMRRHSRALLHYGVSTTGWSPCNGWPIASRRSPVTRSKNARCLAKNAEGGMPRKRWQS